MKNFKINDKVKVVSNNKLKGHIWDCWANYSENIKVENGERIYVVAWDSRSKMVQFNDVKESDLVLIQYQDFKVHQHIFSEIKK